MDGTSTLGEKKPAAYEGLPTQSLPPDVIHAVQEALPTSDPLDRAVSVGQFDLRGSDCGLESVVCLDDEE